MKFSAERESLLAALQSVIGVVERRQTMPILANLLLSADQGKLSVTATDLEVELVATATIKSGVDGRLTVAGRKLLDICRSLPDEVTLTFTQDGDKLTVKAGRSRFVLATLPATDFPVIDELAQQQGLTIAQADLRRLLDKTHFSMAQQDVRYYLNGMLLETDGKMLRTVATDGHRLALCEMDLPAKGAGQQVIVPRKGVLELQRLLGTEGDVQITIGSNHIRAQIGDVRFTSKLIDGRFPEYGRVIPSAPAKAVVADRETLRAALQRTAILANEKYRGIRLALKKNSMTLQAHNPEQEEAEEQVEVSYKGDELEVGFNVGYLLDALAAVDGNEVEIGVTDGNSSCLVRAPGATSARYVVMPMRL
ncbi:MAG TPA: DNA polymerase III subunit beta [Steroidobacteraceae bacterium]|jgi:DNA polymerase-3 subunit beta|nr:DNA polymerase III subunit beta [Steroidobacteraceae bacterium]